MKTTVGLSCGKDCRGWRSQFRSSHEVRTQEWSDSVTPKSLVVAE